MKEDLDRAIAIMEALGDEQDLDRRATEYVKAITPLDTFQEIEQVAKIERDFLEKKFPNLSTRKGKISKAGYLKKSGSILLSESMNATRVGAHLKHYGIDLLITQSEIKQANESTRERTTKRVQSSRVAIRADELVTTATKLISAKDWPSIAVGVLALTGRRPIEVVALGSFSVSGKDHLIFRGQAKTKKLEQTTNKIPCLGDPKKVVAAMRKLKKDPDLAGKIKSVENLEDSKKNDAVGSLTNKVMNRVVSANFAGIVGLRVGEHAINCKALRAAYAAIAIDRHLPGNHTPAYAIEYGAKILGHHDLGSARSYLDYFVQPHPNPPNPTQPNPTPPPKKRKTVAMDPDTEQEYEKLRDQLGLTHSQLMDRLVAIATSPPTAANPTAANPTAANPTAANTTDITAIPKSDLFGDRKIRGSVPEKLRRIAVGIARFNELQPAIENRWLITSSLLQSVSGANGQVVGRWFREQDWIALHNAKMLPGVNDPYFNRKHHSDRDRPLGDICRDKIWSFIP